MPNHDLAHLHAACTTTLERYIGAARSTCELTEKFKGTPLSSEKYQGVVDQRVRELEACEAYHREREALFDAFRPRDRGGSMKTR